MNGVAGRGMFLKKQYILALDSGAVKNRAVIINREGQICSYAEKKISMYTPHESWVEQDPDEIWSTQLFVARKAIKLARLEPSEIAAIAVTNQRETTIVWDEKTGRPIYPAISWQSRQTGDICKRLLKEGYQEEIWQKTSLVIAPYFSGTKLCWIFENVPGARELAQKGRLRFGTVDTWLMWKLSGGEIFATDYSNASRTMLFHIKDLTWDEDILEALDIPRQILPDVYPSSHLYGETAANWLGARIPIASCIGNQQADLFGEVCFKPGEAKNSYGVGSFFLVNTGDCHVRSKNGLVTTIAWGIGDKVTYALEGSTLVSGISLEWLKHGIGILDSMPESEWIAKRVPDTNGVYLVPSFRGLSAPYWDMESKGLIVGLSDDVNRAHIIRAALAALAYQVRDIYEALSPDIPVPIKELKVSGGASQNNLLMQFQADIMGLPVIRPEIMETTALGAAYLAGLAIGFWQNLDELRKLWPPYVRYEPHMDEVERERLYDGWQVAVEQAMAGMR